MQVWTRLCVDVDRAGNVIGASFERHEDSEVVRVSTEPVGPFDTPSEALERLLVTVGVQGALF